MNSFFSHHVFVIVKLGKTPKKNTPIHILSRPPCPSAHHIIDIFKLRKGIV